MNRIRRGLVASAALLGAGGCVSVGRSPPAARTYFVLEDTHAAAVAASPRRDARTLLLTALAPDALADSRALVYSRAAGERAFYQFAAWTDRPSRALLRLVQARLDRRGAFRAVAPLGEGVRGDLLLGLRLDGLYHDLEAQPQLGRITVTAELTRERLLVARRVLAAAAPVAEANARAAADALNEATATLIDALVEWLEATTRAG